MTELHTEYMPLEGIVPADFNPKDHRLDLIDGSYDEFGYVEVVTIDERTGKLLAGHGRIKQLRARQLAGREAPEGIQVQPDGSWLVPVTRGYASEDDDHAAAYLVASNKISEAGGWLQSDAMFAGMLRNLADAETPLLEVTGFTMDDLLAMEGALTPPPVALTDQDAVPDVPKVPRSLRGDVWKLGAHRLMCGDSTSQEDVGRLMGDERDVPLIHADPPYGMGKEADGILNDNLRNERLDAFQMAWWSTWRPYLADNASAYIWGNPRELWRLWFMAGLSDSERLTFRNEIVWDKGGGGFGVGSASQRSYFPEERCLFFMFGEQGFGNVNKDDYWEGFEPIRSYLALQADTMGWTAKDILAMCGVGMYGHWFSKSQWTMIPERHYLTLQGAAAGKAFDRPYRELRQLYDGSMTGADHLSAKHEFYGQRAFFDNTHDSMTDVWKFARVHGAERFEHATPKPVAMIARAIRSSAPPRTLVVEPFGGTGSTLIAAHSTGHRCFTMEIEPTYADVICRRYQEHTGEIPVLWDSGEQVDFIA